MKAELILIATVNKSSIAYLVFSNLENEGIKCFLDSPASKGLLEGEEQINVVIDKTQIVKAIEIINNYIAHRYAAHRIDFISNIYQGSQQLAERSSVIMQGLQSKLAVTGNIQQQVNQILDLTVMKQAYLLTYIDAFLFSAICILVVFPLILLTSSKKITADEAAEVMEHSH